VDRPLVNASLARLATVVPDLEDTRVGRYWGGLIDLTPDGLPVIDGSSGPQGLSIITGLAGHGFTLGPALGEIASDLSLDLTTSRPIESFRLSRFTEGPVAHPEMMI
jgi:sarcosine oxidase subunit beta